MTDSFNQWKTTCPKCEQKGGLVVSEAILVAVGRKIHPNTPLEPTGFDVDPSNEYADLKDHSTDEEIVHCLKCKADFCLEELSLDGAGMEIMQCDNPECEKDLEEGRIGLCDDCQKEDVTED